MDFYAFIPFPSGASLIRISLAQALFVAALTGAGAAHAESSLEMNARRQPDPSQPRVASADLEVPKAQAAGKKPGKPWGSGYEARVNAAAGGSSGGSSSGAGAGAGAGAGGGGGGGGAGGGGGGGGFLAERAFERGVAAATRREQDDQREATRRQ